MNLFEELGGEAKLRTIIDDFVDAMSKDLMIGFFFAEVDIGRLKEMEYQFTARFLGASSPYEGQTIAASHRKHPIMGGHFDRRKQILKDTLEHHAVAPLLTKAWLKHVEDLRFQVTQDAPGQCQAPETEPPPS